jgi:hypothetical protein
MTAARTARTVSLVGTFASIALAVVTYRMSSGQNHGPSWCVFGFAMLEIGL